MNRFVIFLALSTTCGVAQAQTDGGTDTGGGLETTEIAERGIETGPTEQTESGFAGPETSGFAGPGATTFQARNFNGGQTLQQIISGGTTQTQRQVRPSFRLGFVPSMVVTPRMVQSRITRQFTGITPRVRSIQNLGIQAGEKGRVTVTGQATSRYGSLLAAAIARLEPGVRSVRNEVQVIRTAPASAPAATVPTAPFVSPTPAPASSVVPPAPMALPVPPSAPIR